MKCPECAVTLVLADRQGIEIDYCPQCRGVWLDRGELDKIIERSNESHSRKKNEFRDDNQGDYRREDASVFEKHHDGYAKRHKKKSLLDDLFDF